MKICFYNVFSIVLIFAAGCSQNSNQSWEDLKTAGRYMQKSLDSMIGNDYESRMLASDEEFIGPYDGEFIPLNDADLKKSMIADAALPQPKAAPGKNGIPYLDQFYTPPQDLMSIFQVLHFDTDDHILRNKTDVQNLLKVASYLKKNPKVFIVVSGHCDERASAGYNIALGMRRANYIRNVLVKNGVDLNRVYTVSKGKEDPVSLGHSPDDWTLNRRAEFKIFER